MASKELFYDNRPVVLLDPRASKRIDPRFVFTRSSEATYFDSLGVMRTAPAGIPRFDHAITTKEYQGLLLEKTSTNLYYNSRMIQSSDTANPTNWAGWNPAVLYRSTALAPDGTANVCMHGALNGNGGGLRQSFSGFLPNTTYTISYYARRPTAAELSAFTAVYGSTTGTTNGSTNKPWIAGTAARVDTTISGITSLPASGAWVRVVGYGTSDASGDLYTVFNTRAVGNDEGAVIVLWGAQFEVGTIPTSLIHTPIGGQVTRSADLLSVDSVSIPSSGSVFIDFKATGISSGSTLFSLANASNQAINLAQVSRTETYNSLALIPVYSNTAKASLPLPVPTTSRERNIVTWGGSNYHYTKTAARYAASLSASVPTGLTKVNIGSDVVDPTKTFVGYVNAFYMWDGEIQPDIAEALVRGDIVAINADTYSPTGPAGSLSLIINTQGAGTDGNTVFTLPASRATIAATALVVGETYRILSVGTTNFTLVGASANTVGTVFVATGTTTGTGTVAWQNDFVITWGDGTESGLEGAAAEGSAVGLTKTYSQAGIFPVWVSGRMQDIAFNNGTHAPDLVRITTWGTGKMLVKPSTMANAFYGCSKLQSIPSTNLPDTSAITSWSSAFRGCSSLSGTFPSFNTTAATTLDNAWRDCSSLTVFPLLSTGNATSMLGAWDGCSGLTSFPAIDTSKVTNLNVTWRGCTGLTAFPELTTNLVTNFDSAWYNCSSLVSFPLINTAAATNLKGTWAGCNSLTTFPLINTASTLTFEGAWINCYSLTSFPLINTSSGTNFINTWYGCGALTSFPLINTGAGTNFSYAWFGCSSLTSFPQINTSAGTNFDSTWRSCSGLTSFPLINTAAGTNFNITWRDCTGLTSFPLINTAAGTSFNSTWRGCSSLTSFPAISTSAGIDFSGAWQFCASLTTFPALNMAAGTTFPSTWNGCTSLTTFPSISFTAAVGTTVSNTGFENAWLNCTALTTFPANAFNTTAATRFLGAFQNCALTAASIENIIVSINTAGTSNGTLSLQGGTNAGASTWTANAVTAYNALIARGWTITRNA